MFDAANPVADRYGPPACGELTEITDVLADGRLSGGAPILPMYEQALAGWFGVKRTVAVNSGTSALHAALIALDVRPGDEVLVPATETGIHAEVISEPPFAHPSVTVHAGPFAILEMQVSDSKIGVHRHIDFVYVLRAVSGELTAQLEEVGGVQWVPVADVAGLDTPAELPALVADAARWAKAHR